MSAQSQQTPNEKPTEDPASVRENQVLQPCLLHCAATKTDFVKKPRETVIRKRHILRSLKFHEVNFAVGLANITLGMSFFIIPPLAEDAGITRSRQSFILLLMGFSDILGRLLCGYLSDRFPKARSAFFMAVNVLLILTWVFPIINLSFASVLIFSLVLNLFAAFQMTLSVPLVIDIFGLENVEASIAYGTCVDALSFIIFPPLSSFVRELTGTWQSACGIVAILIAFGLVVFSRHLIFALYRKKLPAFAAEDGSTN